MSEKNQPATINEIVLEAAKAAIAANAGKREWNQDRHVSFLVRLAMGQGLPKASAKVFAALLGHKGAGGNASQFRQWLEASGDKGPGLVDPAPKATRLAEEF